MDGAASGVTKRRHDVTFPVDLAQRKRSCTSYRIYPKENIVYTGRPADFFIWNTDEISRTLRLMHDGISFDMVYVVWSVTSATLSTKLNCVTNTRHQWHFVWWLQQLWVWNWIVLPTRDTNSMLYGDFSNSEYEIKLCYQHETPIACCMVSDFLFRSAMVHTICYWGVEQNRYIREASHQYEYDYDNEHVINSFLNNQMGLHLQVENAHMSK
jgi:hypothetical protein